MPPNLFLGVLLQAIGGFAAGSFYAPLKKVQQRSWASFWEQGKIDTSRTRKDPL